MTSITAVTDRREPQTAKLRAWAILIWLLIWELCARLLSIPIALATPSQVLVRLLGLLPELGFWSAVGFSLLRITTGFLLGTAVAVLMAALSARHRWFHELLLPLMGCVRSVPVASLIILALILFSSGNLSVLISFLMVLPVMFSSVLEGIQKTDPALLEMAEVFRVSGARRLRYIYIPEVMPFFLGACRSSMGLAWKSGVAAEVIGMPVGSIGERLQQAKIFLDTPELFAWTLVILILSQIFEKVIMFLLTYLSKSLSRMR